MLLHVASSTAARPFVPAPPAPPSPTGPQLYRLQYLLEWLRSGRPLTAGRAAGELEVSERTVASDIAYLRHVGVPLAFDRRRNTYVLTEPFGNLPLAALSRTDLAAFLVAQHALDALGDTVHAPLLAGVAERLARHLPESVRVAPETLARTIRFDPGPRPHARFPWLATLEEAVREGRAVWMRYVSNSQSAEADRETERVVEPYFLLCHQGRWYLVAFCRLRQAMRDFRLDRIQALEVTGDVFAVPADFDEEAYLGPAFGVHRGERTFAVCVRFTKYQARWVREERWHPSQVMTERGDGSLDVRMQVAGLVDVARWALSYGGEAEVLSPPVLRHRVAREARRMAARYARDTGLSDAPRSSADDPSTQ